MAVEAPEIEGATYPRGFSIDTDWKWPMIPARELVKLNYGRALKADTRSPGNVPVFGTNGQCGWHDAPLAKAPGLILGRKGQGPLGVEWSDKDFWVIDTAYYASILTPDIDLKYLYHLVNYVGLNHLKDGTSNPTLSRDAFGSQLFPLPPLAEQKAIAAVLGGLDDKIELNRRMNAKLEEMARALFQSWFVDFNPVRAKVDGHMPVGLDPGTASLFPIAFQDSEAGHIPQGWTVEQVGEVTDCVGGGTPSTTEPKFWEGGTHHWATPKDLSSLETPILLDTARKLTEAGIAKISSGLLPAGTLLLSSRAPVGYLAIASMPVAINQGFIALKCNERASNFFLLNWCKVNMDEIESRATGTTFAEISKQSFRPICVVLPPSEVMSAFTEEVAPLYSQITANLQQSRSLASLRDTLLPKLISGQMKMPEVEKSLARNSL